MILPGGVKRIQGTFKDENDTLYDPTSAEIKIYDSVGTLTATKALTDCTNVSPGIWYLDYTVPAAGPIGRWTVSWSNTVGTKNYLYPFAFIVWEPSWPTIAEVRVYLADMGTKRLSDETIEIQIATAAEYVTYNKTTLVPLAIVNQAILARAVYLSYVAYAAEYERTAGRLPEAIDRQIQRYYIISERAIALVQMTGPAPGTPGGQPILVPGGMITLAQLRTDAIEDNEEVTDVD
jgi:hypothetical protein